MKGYRLIKVLGVLAVMLTAMAGYAVLAQDGESAVEIAAGGFGVLAQDETDSAADTSVLRFEVAEDGTRFAFGTERLHEDGMPAYGSPFVTYGYLYPEGTLNGTNGVLASGEPEFPDQVIGTWICYGYMIADGAHTTTGAWVVSTQVYQFDEKLNNATIITDGLELADFNVPISRAITGGTSEFAGASGEQIQELLGFTEQMGVNLTVELQLTQDA